MAIAIYLEPERTPSRYSHVAQPQILVDGIHVVVQAFAIVWLQVCLVRLLVMPRLVATTGLHRGQNAHQSRLFSTLVQHLFDPFLLAELLLTSNKFDLDSVRGGDTLHVLPNGVAQRLCPLRVVENADLVLVEVVRHALGVAPLWNRPLDDDPVVAGKNASDLALVPLGQEFDAHSGIITDILFGSGYAGLGVLDRRWFAFPWQRPDADAGAPRPSTTSREKRGSTRSGAQGPARSFAECDSEPAPFPTPQRNRK